MNVKLEPTKFVKVKNVVIPDVFYRRMQTGIEKVDAAFGGGILPGSSITLTARAGLGKTTLMLQLLQALHKNGYKVGYCSTEESVAQLALTCKRLDVTDLMVCNEADVDTISKQMDNLDVVVVDSFQGLTAGKLRNRELEKYLIEKLVVRAKETECAIFMVCHHTKAGGIKGSSLIIHAVDVNMGISGVRDGEANMRRIYFDKNRFGPAHELMTQMLYAGYDFNSEVVVPQKINKKKQPKIEQRKQLISLLESNKQLTLKQACDKLKMDSTRLGYLLRELVSEGLVIKKGRGGEAIWHIAVRQEGK
jgi:predicted ATP-dependent serine protease